MATSAADLVRTKWGPSLVQGSKFLIYQGRMQPIPAGWKDVSRYLKELKHLEKIQWAYALPHEREALFQKKLEILTRNLPPDWTMIVGDTICLIIIIAKVASIVCAKL